MWGRACGHESTAVRPRLSLLVMSTPSTEVTDTDVDEFKQLYLEHEGVELTPDKVREMLSRMLVLVERFAVWVAKERAAGRVFQIDERPRGLSGT